MDRLRKNELELVFSEDNPQVVLSQNKASKAHLRFLQMQAASSRLVLSVSQSQSQVPSHLQALLVPVIYIQYKQ